MQRLPLHIPSIAPKFLRPPAASRQFSASSPTPKSGFVGWYLRKLDTNPLATKTVTTSLIYAAADVTAQMITLDDGSGSLDHVRTMRMAGYGLLALGPSQHFWFNWMSRRFPHRDMVTTAKKIFMGQAVYGPANATLFFSYNAALQGENGGEIVARLKRDLLPTLRNGLLYWPICDFATYKFVPVHLQVVELASSEQHLCISVDGVLNIYGKLNESRIVHSELESPITIPSQYHPASFRDEGSAAGFIYRGQFETRSR